MWLTILVSSFLVADASVQPERSWATVPIITQAPITVCLKVRKQASLADEHWIGFEFENTGDEAFRFEEADYRMDYEAFNLRTGARFVTHRSSVRGDCLRSFPPDWKEGPNTYWLMPPGVFSTVEQPSDESAASLGLPPRDGLLVRGRVHFAFKRRRVEGAWPEAAEVPFTFKWVYPDKDGLAAIRQSLKSILKEPPTKHGVSYLNIRYELLGVSEFREGLSVQALLSAMDRMRRPSQKLVRNGLAQSIIQHHRHHPEVLAYYLRCIKKEDSATIMDLHRWGGIWHDGFLQPLLAICEGEHLAASYPALLALARHRERWSENSAIPSRLSSAVIRWCPILLKKPDELDERKLVERWKSAARALAWTGDAKMIPLVVPFLDCRTRILEGSDFAIPYGVGFYPGGYPELRVCDVALHVILTLMGENVDEAYGIDVYAMLKLMGENVDEACDYGPYWQRPRKWPTSSPGRETKREKTARPPFLPLLTTKPALVPDEDANAYVCRERDAMIAELKKRLDLQGNLR